MIRKLQSSPYALLLGLLLTLAGLFVFSLSAEQRVLGAVAFLVGSLLIYLSQRRPSTERAT